MGVCSLTKRRAVFLDRDGVLNRAIVRDGRPFSPGSLEEVELLEGAADACDTLHRAGFLLIVVTNQPDVARGTQSREVVEAINDALRGWLPIDDIRVCYHDDGEACSCRKPAPGLLLDAAGAWKIAIDKSFLVGDRWRDIEAGRRAGCRTILIDYGYKEPHLCQPDFRTRSLVEAADLIMSHFEYFGGND